MQIHISQSTQELLSPSYKVKERGEIEVKGKGKTIWKPSWGLSLNRVIGTLIISRTDAPGTMKTYWLEKRERRSVATKGITIQEPHIWHRNSEKRVSSVGVMGLITPSIFDKTVPVGEPPSRRGSSKMSSPTPPGSSGIFSEERRIYSPITFQDVARRSVANSPTKNVEVRGISSSESQLSPIRRLDFVRSEEPRDKWHIVQEFSCLVALHFSVSSHENHIFLIPESCKICRRLLPASHPVELYEIIFLK